MALGPDLWARRRLLRFALRTGEENRNAMHFEIHQQVIDDLEARILTIRDSL
jgi:hypothetical protein